jgi:hypothetical protein
MNKLTYCLFLVLALMSCKGKKEGANELSDKKMSLLSATPSEYRADWNRDLANMPEDWMQVCLFDENYAQQTILKYHMLDSIVSIPPLVLKTLKTVSTSAPTRIVGCDAQGKLISYHKDSIRASMDPVSHTVNRSLSTTGSNNTFTVSSAKGAWVAYTVNFAIALTLTTSNGVVDLDFSTNGGSTWTTVSSVSQAYTLAVTLTNNNNQVLAGFIPKGALVRLNRVSNTNVTITLPSNKSQEAY